MIRARKGHLDVTASHELAVKDLARYFEISVEDMIRRISTKHPKEVEREILNHS